MTRAKLIRGVSLAVLVVSTYWSIQLARPAGEDTGDTENPDLHMSIGQRAEFAGELALAESSLLRAAAISRFYQPRYLLTQFYFRHPDRGDFWKWWRAAMDTAYGDTGALLELAWHNRPDSDWLWSSALPRRPGVVRQYLGFLDGKGERKTSATVAEWIAANGGAADRQALLIWIDARLAGGDIEPARTVWNSMCRRGLLPYSATSLLTNADFARAPLSAGFDWRPTGTPGVTTTISHGILRAAFTGSQPEHCTLVWQYINAAPGTRLRLKQDPPTDGLTWILEGGRVRLVYDRPPGSTRRSDTAIISAPQLEAAP